jgi:hypothetical protein
MVRFNPSVFFRRKRLRENDHNPSRPLGWLLLHAGAWTRKETGFEVTHERRINHYNLTKEPRQAATDAPKSSRTKKACEGVTHSSAGSGATSTRCTCAHPRAIETPPNDPFQITQGLRGYCRVPILRYPKEGELTVPNDQNRTDGQRT